MMTTMNVTTKHPLSLLPLALALLLAGCAGTRTTYQAPDATVPAAWAQQQATGTATATSRITHTEKPSRFDSAWLMGKTFVISSVYLTGTVSPRFYFTFKNFFPTRC